MTLLLTLALLLLPTLAGAQYTIPYEFPSSPGTICPNATYTGCTTGLEENDAALLAGLNAIDGDADGSVSQCDAASSVGTLCPVGQYARGITTGFAGDGCTSAAGAGDMLELNWRTGGGTWGAGLDTNSNNVVDTSEGLTCSGCVSDSDISTFTLATKASDDYVASIDGVTGTGLVIGGATPNRTIGLKACAVNELLINDGSNDWHCIEVPYPIAFYTSDLSAYDLASPEDQCVRLSDRVNYNQVDCYDASGNNAAVTITEKATRSTASGTSICSGPSITATDAGATCTASGAGGFGIAGDWLCLSAVGTAPASVVGCTVAATLRD